MSGSFKRLLKHRIYKDLGLPYFVPNDDTSDRSTESEVSEVEDVEEFVSRIVPTSEVTYVRSELGKTNVSLRLRSCLWNRAKPIGRRVGLSQRERRAAGLLRLPRFSTTYEEALPMNRMWEQYMHRFLNFEKLQGKKWYNPKSGAMWDQMRVTLMKADFHGAHVKVVSSLCTSMIGLEGIVVIDTKYTFQIIGKDDICRTIPKESCSFEVFFKNMKFRIFGKYFSIRSSERSTKKVKCSFIPSL